MRLASEITQACPSLPDCSPPVLIAGAAARSTTRTTGRHTAPQHKLRSADVFLARISGRTAVRGDQDPVAGPAAQVGRLVLTALERVVASAHRRR
jgi:hypothetical protein